jgi:hypothetical protein
MSIRYLRHYYVDGIDRKTFLIDTNVGRDGKTHPNIRNLDVKFWTTDNQGIDYCLSIVNDDDAIIPNDNGIEILSFESWSNRVESIFNKIIEENNLQNENYIFDKTSLETIEQSFSILNDYFNNLNEQTT